MKIKISPSCHSLPFFLFKLFNRLPGDVSFKHFNRNKISKKELSMANEAAEKLKKRENSLYLTLNFAFLYGIKVDLY